MRTGRPHLHADPVRAALLPIHAVGVPLAAVTALGVVVLLAVATEHIGAVLGFCQALETNDGMLIVRPGCGCGLGQCSRARCMPV